MRKKLLSILVLSILIAIALAGCSQEPPAGNIAETPTPSPSSLPTSTPTPPAPSEPEAPAPPPSLPETPSTLTMLSISEGKVFVMKAGTDNWIEAQVGMSLEIGDIVKSGNNSNAEITFFDGSTIELQAGTQIEVASLDIAAGTGSTTIVLKQEIGKTISRVTKLADPASRYEVETPAGVAAVRGSSMLVEVANGITWVTNLEGEIWVIANGVELQVPQGMTCIIRAGQSPQLLYSGGWWGGGSSPAINPDIAVTKTAEPTQAHEGDTITYTYTVTNTGNTPLSDISVSDDKAEDVTYQDGDTNEDSKLGTDETWTFTASYEVTAEDVSPLVNTASASGTDALSQTVIAWATASVDILRPAIDISKEADTAEAHEGDTITYTYTVTNTGNTPLSDISVSDDKAEDVTYQDGDTNEDSKLGTDETWTFTASYEVTAEDVSPLVNTATASGTDALGQAVESEEATASVTILRRVTMTVISDTNTLVTYSSSGYASSGDPAELAWVHANWWPNLTYSFPNGAQWIWESYRTQNPVAGDIVDFEKTFDIPGTLVSATLYITCDNGYEAYLNDQFVGSAQLGAGWRTSDLTESYVNSSGWQSVESWDITALLQSGSNTLDIGTANEQMDGGTIDSNPAGLIFEIVITYDIESTSSE
jgi:uncharacterized repeat protein (TIGR01451 family)